MSVVLIVIGVLLGLALVSKTKNTTVDQLLQKNQELENLTKQLKIDLDKETETRKMYQSKQKSEQVRLGFIAEKLAPFLKDFGHDAEGLCPVFKPIDYIHFGEKQITFIEVKSGNAKLSQKQKNIKALIDKKQVKFEEYRI